VKYPAEIERGWGFLLKDVSRLHVKRFEQRAKLHGLTLSECRVLIYLSHEEGVTQVRLAALTDIEPMTLVRMLDRMEADGWLERRSNPSDRRSRHIHAKPKGRALMNAINQLVELTRAEALAGIAKKNVDLLMTLLEKIRGNLLTLEPIVPTADTPRRAPAARRKASA
jgi:MarR family transcriptional regulator for hemolysin